MGGDERDAARRPLTRTERALLDSLLAHQFDGVEELRVQARHAMASMGCECGCGMIDLHVPAELPASSAGSPAPVEGTVLDARGEPIGGLLLFIEHGRLSGLEIYSDEDAPALPAPERVRWETGEDGEDEFAVGERRSWWSRLRPRQRRPRPGTPASR